MIPQRPIVPTITLAVAVAALLRAAPPASISIARRRRQQRPFRHFRQQPRHLQLLLLGLHVTQYNISVVAAIIAIVLTFLFLFLFRLRGRSAGAEHLSGLRRHPPDVVLIGGGGKREAPGGVGEVETGGLPAVRQCRHVVSSGRHFRGRVSSEPDTCPGVGLAELADPLAAFPAPHASVHRVARLPEDSPPSPLLRHLRRQLVLLLLILRRRRAAAVGHGGLGDVKLLTAGDHIRY
ncbi:unnamed protein product [Linum tenue]|uniref:Uncharacterized protein n=1 Tax=Linum tenue TaxID=586396 RepID=A0AAV0Q1K4_9ROSI|nr:unnamed protein product [Linum tenue]